MLKQGFCGGGVLKNCFQAQQNKVTSLIPSFSALNSSEHWMCEALKEAMQSVGITSPNPAVGCVIVEGDTCIARGSTEVFGGRHAEKVAFEKLSKASHAVAYVTLEPCSHHGKQPPCAELFLNSAVKKVIVASSDVNPLVSGKGLELLRNHGIEVELGTLQNEARAWMLPFFIQKSWNRPAIALKWAQTLDGKLADFEGSSQWITNPHSRAYSHWLRQKYDVCMVGVGTVLADFPSLTSRDSAGPFLNQPMKAVFDPEGILLKANDKFIIEKLKKTTFLNSRIAYFVKSEHMQNHSSTSSPFPLEVFPLKTDALIEETLSLLVSERVTQLRGRPIESVFVEGGPTLLNGFLERGLGDIFHVFTAPFLLGESSFTVSKTSHAQGSSTGLSFPRTMAKSIRKKLLANFVLENDVVTEYVSDAVATAFFTEYQ